MTAARDTVALLPAPALGDGLLALVLAHNLHRAGRPATLYHDALLELATWLPWAHIEGRPSPKEGRALLAGRTHAFVGDPAFAPAAGPTHLVFGKAHWDRRRPYLRSLETHATRVLDLAWTTDAAGLVRPGPADARPDTRRVVLHPFSARRSKDWPTWRWLQLTRRLERDGWEPRVLLAPGEEQRWREEAGGAGVSVVPGPLPEVAAWLAASAGAVVGDSGIGHLAAALGMPTVSIFRKRSNARFWAPRGARTAAVTPRLRLPGSAGHRHWVRLLGSARVSRTFERLVGPRP